MSRLLVRPLQGRVEAEWCARTRSASEPWITLRRGYEDSLLAMLDPEREVWVGWKDDARVGFLVLQLKGAFVGYVQTLCVVEALRGRGLGSQLLGFAEERIFREFKNVFICVSSFNPRARKLYERLGYQTVGPLRDFVVAGHDEILLRKTRGPLAD